MKQPLPVIQRTAHRLPFCAALLVFLSLVLSNGRLLAQGCCLTNSLNISTGYNPLTGTYITPGRVGSPVHDPHWNVCHVTPDFSYDISHSPGHLTVESSGGADVVIASHWWTSFPSTQQQWITCFDSSTYTSTGKKDDSMTLCRQFTMSCASAVTFNLMIYADNYIPNINVDGVNLYTEPNPGLGAGDWGGEFRSFAASLTAGTHTLSITVNQDSAREGDNAAGLAISGTINALSAVFVTETASCVGTKPACVIPTVTGPNTVCVGATITLTGGASGGTWSDDSYSEVVSTISGPPHDKAVIKGITAGVTIITYTDGCGRVGTYSVTVEQAPVVSASSGTACIGSPLNLYSSVTSGCTGGCTYSWSGPSGWPAPSGANPVNSSATTAMTGTYILTVTNSYGCSANASTTVVVNPVPVVTSSYSPDPLCENADWTLTASSSCTGCSYYTYSWSGPGSFTSGASSNDMGDATLAQSGTYSVTATNNFGCSAGQTITVSVNPTPVVSITPSSVAICPGESVPLTGSASITGGGSMTYSWSPAGGTGLTATVSPTVTTTYYFTATSTSASACAATASVSVVVNPVPLVTLSYSPDPLCENTDWTLAASSSCTSCGSFGYSWTGPGSFTSGSFSNDMGDATLAQSGTYSVTVTNNFGCSTNAVITVTVNPTPVVSATASPSGICPGGSTMLTGTASISDGESMTYTWAPGSGSSTTETVSPGVTTTYTFTATSAYGCPAVALTTVTVFPIPVFTAMYSPDPLCETVDWTLFTTPSCTGCGLFTYSWTGPGGFTSTTYSTDMGDATLSQAGDYFVTVTNDFGCSASGDVKVAVNPMPVISSLVASPPEICLGSSSTLEATITCSSPVTLTWAPTGGTAFGDDYTVTPAATTAYTLSVSAGACTAVDYATVIVDPIPVISGTEALCVSNVTALSATPSFGTWASSDPSVATVDPLGGLVTGMSPGTANITYTSPTLAACTAIVTVTVYPIPAPVFGTNRSPMSDICVDGSTYIYADPGADVAFTTWSSSDITVATVSPATGVSTTISGIAPGTAIITFTSTSVGGCSTSIYFPITVHEVPSFTIAPSPSPFLCEGTDLTLNTTVISGCTGGCTGGWSGPLGFVATFGNFDMGPATVPMSGVYTETVTNGFCTSVESFSVVVTPMPVPSITSFMPDLCNGQTETVTSGAGIGTTTAWYSSTPSVTLSSATSTSVVATAASPGTSTITFTSTFTSSTSVCTGSVTATINVHPNPVVTITPAGTGTPPYYDFCGDGGLTLSATSTVLPVTYTWSPGTYLSGTTGSPVTYTPGAPMTYTVTAEDDIWKCTGSSTLEVIPASSCVCTYQSEGFPFGAFAPTGFLDGATATSYTGLNLYMGNDVTVTGTPGAVVVLTNCVIAIGPGLNMYVQPGVRLVLKHCHLFCCPDQMWQGITLQNNVITSFQGELTLIENTLIEDAAIAVYIPNPLTPPGYTAGTLSHLIVHSNGAVFNKNLTGIQISDYTASIAPATTGAPLAIDWCYPFVIENTVFTSRNFWNYNTAYGGLPGTGWPFAWPATTGSSDALKTSWTPVTPYDPPYNIDNPAACATGPYTPTTCNDGALANQGISLQTVGTTSGSTGSAVYSGMVTGSIPASGDELNLFDNLNTGIYALDANLVVRNCAFMHINAGAGSGIGDGIYALDDYATGNIYKLWVYGAGTGTATSSSFYDCVNGVETHEYYNVNVSYANFMSDHSGTNLADPKGQYGITMQSANYYDVQANYNNIYNVTTGISHISTNPASGEPNLYGQIAAKWNNIYQTNIMGGTPSFNEYVSQAISITNTSSLATTFTGAEVNADDNTLSNVFNGIYINNFDNQTMYATAQYNTITLAQDIYTSAALSAPQTGIDFESIDPAVVLDNNITGPGHDVPPPPALYGYPMIEGIHTANVTGRASEIGCNSVTEINTGFYFASGGESWINNTMNNDAYGFVLNGSIGDQGNVTQFCGNQWTTSGMFMWGGTNYQTYTMNSTNPGYSKLYVDGSSMSSIPTVNGWETGASPYAGGASIITITGTAYTCEAAPASTVGYRVTHGNSTNGGPAVVPKNEQAYTVMPNPSDGNLSISQLFVRDEPATVRVTDCVGRTIYMGQVPFTGGKAALNLPDVVPGVYLLELEAPDHTRNTYRIVIER